MLTSKNIRSRDDALVFLTECCLATLDHLVDLSRPPKQEIERQISIAQTGIDWIKTAESRERSSRVDEVIDRGGSVREWLSGRSNYRIK